MQTKNTYHTDLIIACKLDLLDPIVSKTIPASTKYNWRNKNIHSIIGSENAITNPMGLKMTKTFLSNKKAFRFAKAAYHTFSFYHKLVEKCHHCKQKMVREKDKVIKIIDHIRPMVGLKKAFHAFHISSQQYYRWKAQFNCVKSFFDVCLIRKPNQLHVSEVNTIKKYLNTSELLPWPLASVYFKMMRDNAAFMSLNTFYKYANSMIKNRLVTFRKRKRKKRYKGLKASHLFEFIHIDVTITKTLDNTRVYLYFIQDNFSKAILAWTASTEYNAHICMQNLKSAVDKYQLNSQKAKIICDGGIENKGEAEEYLQSISIEKLVAQKDIVFSNSLVEAFNKRIKYRFLFL